MRQIANCNANLTCSVSQFPSYCNMAAIKQPLYVMGLEGMTPSLEVV